MALLHVGSAELIVLQDRAAPASNSLGSLGSEGSWNPVAILSCCTLEDTLDRLE